MKYLKNFFMAGFLLANLSLQADLPQPYNSIRNLPPAPYYVQDAYNYNNLISSNNASIIVDVESQDGGVARYLAQQIDNLPSISTIYAVNSWTNCDLYQKNLFQKFLSNVKQENTANLIIPIRMSSKEAAAALNIKADFISLNGVSDQDRVYHDILTWYPHLSNVGILCGNNWNDICVQLGVIKAAAALHLTLQTNGNIWFFNNITE
jgi:hypothetical protein